MTISLAFLAPDLVKAAIDGRLPYGMGIARLTDLPAEWSRQREMLGFPFHFQTESLPTPVSAVGKRDFAGQRQRPRNGPSNSIGRLQRQNACTNRRQFGAIRTEPGNPRLRRTAWWGWEDSNLQPN